MISDRIKKPGGIVRSSRTQVGWIRYYFRNLLVKFLIFIISGVRKESLFAVDPIGGDGGLPRFGN